MIRINTLGTARVDIDARYGRIRITPAAGKRFGLLLYLVTQPGCRAARATLRELLFPPTTDGRHGLRELLYQLRLCGVETDSDAHTVAISPTSVRRDWTAVTEGARLTPSLLRSAEGGFLPGYRPSLSGVFWDWYTQFHTRTVAELSRGMLREVERSLKSGDFYRAEQAARGCMALEPSNGEATVALAHAVAQRASVAGGFANPHVRRRI